MPVRQKYTSYSKKGGPTVHCLYEPETGSWQYVCADPATGQCAIIDPVLDFDPAHARTSTESAEELLGIVEQYGYDVQWILDTHPHADHLTAGRWLADRTGAPHAVGEKVTDIAKLWRDYYHLPDAFPVAVRRQSFSDFRGHFLTEALVRFRFKFRRQWLDAATGVFGLSVS